MLEMMKLGKVINEKTTETIEMYTFELAEMAWRQPSMVEFSIAKEPFGKSKKHSRAQVKQWGLSVSSGL